MAWLEQTYMNGQHKYWTDTDTGEMVYTDPRQSGGEVITEAPKATWTESKYMDGQHSAYTNDKTGEIVYNKDATLTDAERQQQFMDLWNNPDASSWDKAQAVQKQYGIETLAQLVNQGQFSDVPDIGAYVAARQREANDAGFTVGGNKLGLWPVALGTAGFAAAGAAGAGAAGAAAGAEGASVFGGLDSAAIAGADYGAGAAAGGTGSALGGLSSSGEFTGGLTGTATGNPGFSGTVTGSPGLTTTSASGSLSPGYFASEGVAAAGAAGLEGAAGSGTLGALGGAGAGTAALSSAAAGGGSSALSADGGGGGGAAGGAGGAASGGSLMDSWLTDDDAWMKMLGQGLPGLLGAFGAYNQSQDYKDLANQYQAMGAPYRSKLGELYGNPSAFLNSAEVRVPIQQGTDMLARSLSTKGNPVGSGNALQEIQNYASNQLFSRLGQEKDRLAGFGGLTQYNSAAPQAAQNQLQAQKGIYDAFGGMAADVFNPPKKYSLQDLLRGM